MCGPVLVGVVHRNWPYAWKKEAATDEQYGGATPFSEPQSRLVRAGPRTPGGAGFRNGGIRVQGWGGQGLGMGVELGSRYWIL